MEQHDVAKAVPAEIWKALPGIFGAALAMLFYRDESWSRRLGMFLGGSVFARYGGPAASNWTGFDQSFSGLLVGLFGMALIASVFETWRSLHFGPLLMEKLRIWLGLPPKGD